MLLTGKNLIWVAFAAVMVFILSSCEKKESAQTPEVTGEFNAEFLDIGKADAMLLKTQNHTVIIDCGEKDDGKEILAKLQDKGIESVDYMFITHFDRDHVGGAPKIINSIEIGKIVTPDYDGNNSEYEKFIQTLEQNNISETRLTKEMCFVLDDVFFQIYPPQKTEYNESDNDFSLVIKVTHGNNTFLFAGDAEAERLLELDKQLILKSDFLKVPHHGRDDPKISWFISKVLPEYAVVCDSEKNPASEEVAQVLQSIFCNTYFTRNGDIELKSDGTSIVITQNN